MSINHQARWQSPSQAKTAGFTLRGLAHRAGGLACFGVALTLLLLGKLQPESMQALRLSATGFLTESAATLAAPLDALQSVGAQAAAWSGALAENRRLHLELQGMQAAHARLDELTAENDRLRALARVATPEAPIYIAARVVSLAGGSAQQAIWIDAGAADGVEKDMVAMAPEGLVGRVLEVAEHRARLLLLTDASSRLPVQSGQSRFHAIAAGAEGSGLLGLRHLPPHAELQAGEMVVTAGDGHLLPVGIPVGLIEADRPKTPSAEGAVEIPDASAHAGWHVRPLADLSRLDLLSVLVLPPTAPH